MTAAWRTPPSSMIREALGAAPRRGSAPRVGEVAGEELAHVADVVVAVEDVERGHPVIPSISSRLGSAWAHTCHRQASVVSTSTTTLAICRSESRIEPAS